MRLGSHMAAVRLSLRLWRLRDNANEMAATHEELRQLVIGQTAWWEENAPLRPPEASETLRHLNHRSWSVYVFSVSEGRIAIWPKPWLTVRRQDQRLYAFSRRAYGRRAALCRAYLEHVLKRAGNTASFDFAFDAADEPCDSAAVPIFSMNKKDSAHNILLPDTEFFEYDWYRNDRDPFSYEAKTLSACFVGGSTGGNLVTRDKIRDRAMPRLRAAEYFRQNPDVMFRISAAANCESPEVELYMREQPWFGPYVPWQDQLRHRFLISMDGNGAAWSRVVRSMRSNSVLLKYESPMVMYYYPALKAGENFLLIREDADIPGIIAQERAEPGKFRQVAQAGSLFAQKFLNPASVSNYTALLLARFSEMR